MILGWDEAKENNTGFPRRRGGDPTQRSNFSAVGKFPPQVRGWLRFEVIEGIATGFTHRFIYQL